MDGIRMSSTVPSQTPCLLRIQHLGEILELHPEHALFWPAREALLLSDLHWGKAETFQQHGVPVPGSLLQAELDRLDGLLLRTQPKRVWILGDLIHSALGITPTLENELSERLRKWSRWGARFSLILGNHDRKMKKFPANWPVDLLEGPFLENPFAFAHEPSEIPAGRYGFCGHLHPTTVLRAGADRLRLSCFYFARNYAVLPAFSHFTRGVIVQKNLDERLFVVADDRVIEI